MRKIREILRLKHAAGLSIRQIHVSTKVSVGAIQKLLSKAEKQQLTWPLPEGMDDRQLARLFYPAADTALAKRFENPDCSGIHQELKRKGVTRLLLWEEYTQQFPNRCLSYSQFCDRYRQWLKKQKRSMRQTHRAGEKLFVDYAGATVPIVNATTGEIREAQIFVAVLGASNYTFCEATWSQRVPDWLASHVRAFEFFGGTPMLVVPDNLKSGVRKACRYEPELNPSYQQLAAHYDIAVIPARPYKPKDKAKAEVGVQIIERWILARLRHQTFFSLAELNQCIRMLLEQVNQKPFKQRPGNRRQCFEQLDQPALAPLPRHPYQYTDIKTAKVNVDYHIQYDQHLYSVPHHLVGEKVELHATDTLIQIYFQTKPICSHVRNVHPGTTTEPCHMPERHVRQQQWTPGRLKAWAQKLGPHALQWITTQLERKRHPEQAYRVCLGLLNLSRDYPAQRVDRACQIADQKSLYKLKHIKAILRSNQDQLAPHNESPTVPLPQQHENIRGPQNFH